jgi:hypothetical protein
MKCLIYGFMPGLSTDLILNKTPNLILSGAKWRWR